MRLCELIFLSSSSCRVCVRACAVLWMCGCVCVCACVRVYLIGICNSRSRNHRASSSVFLELSCTSRVFFQRLRSAHTLATRSRPRARRPGPRGGGRGGVGDSGRREEVSRREAATRSGHGEHVGDGIPTRLHTHRTSGRVVRSFFFFFFFFFFLTLVINALLFFFSLSFSFLLLFPPSFFFFLLLVLFFLLLLLLILFFFFFFFFFCCCCCCCFCFSVCRPSTLVCTVRVCAITWMPECTYAYACVHMWCMR